GLVAVGAVGLRRIGSTGVAVDVLAVGGLALRVGARAADRDDLARRADPGERADVARVVAVALVGEPPSQPLGLGVGVLVDDRHRNLPGGAVDLLGAAREAFARVQRGDRV